MSGTIKAVIFDLDGVVVSTDEQHYRAWQQLADEEGIYFDREINQRLRGVSRMESLAILLERSPRAYTREEKEQLASRKNRYYRESLEHLNERAILPGAMDVLKELKRRGIKAAVASSSKNAPLILDRVGLASFFDATSDGNDISRSKPDPEVFLLAAERLGEAPADCLVVEDADAGVEAGLAAGMRVLAVGAAAENQRATFAAADLSRLDVSTIVARGS